MHEAYHLAAEANSCRSAGGCYDWGDGWADVDSVLTVAMAVNNDAFVAVQDYGMGMTESTYLDAAS